MTSGVLRARYQGISWSMGSAEADRRLYSMKLLPMWKFVSTQPLSFWLLCAYLFFEYVRPQSIYPALSVIPWTTLCIVGSAVAFYGEGNRFRVASPANKALMGYTAIVVASTILAYSPSAALKDWYLYFSWMLIYLLITNILNTERRFLVFLITFLLYNLKMSQHGFRSWAGMGFGYDREGVTGAPGWFQNSGEFGIEMTIFLPIALFLFLALWRYWGKVKRLLFLALPASAAIGMVASTSRGAVLGGAAVLLWFLLKSRHKIPALMVTAVVVVGVYFIIPPQQMDRFRASGTDNTSVARLQYWKDGITITNEHPLLGVGYSNWLPYYRTHYNPQGQLPHNIFIQASSELGYTGFAAFLSLIGITLLVNYRTRRLAARLPQGLGRFSFYMAHGLDGALIGFLVSGFFVTVLYYPFFWINLAMSVALAEAARREAVRQAVVSPAPPVWTGVSA